MYAGHFPSGESLWFMTCMRGGKKRGEVSERADRKHFDSKMPILRRLFGNLDIWNYRTAMSC